MTANYGNTSRHPEVRAPDPRGPEGGWLVHATAALEARWISYACHKVYLRMSQPRRIPLFASTRLSSIRRAHGI